jgi:hypothetical protein
MVEFLPQMNSFCSSFPLWSISFTGGDGSAFGGNSYTLACNFVTQNYMNWFNPDDGINTSYNPTALFIFYDNEIKSVDVVEGIMTIYTITGIYTCDGIKGIISKENYR